jgi:hypothetical protein
MVMKDEMIFEQLADIRERLSSIETLIKERDIKSNNVTMTISAIVASIVAALLNTVIRP